MSPDIPDRLVGDAHRLAQVLTNVLGPDTAPNQSPDLEGLRVLVVDDNATNRRLLEGMLSRWQMRPTSVASGEHALAALDEAHRRGAPFPLVLLDVNMPGPDGFEVAAQIQNRPALAGPLSSC